MNFSAAFTVLQEWLAIYLDSTSKGGEWQGGEGMQAGRAQY